MEGELFDRKIMEQLTAGALRRACRSRGAPEDFLDPESGRDPTKEDLLAWLEANWGASSRVSELGTIYSAPTPRVGNPIS